MQHVIGLAAWIIAIMGFMGGLPNEPFWNAAFYVSAFIMGVHVGTILFLLLVFWASYTKTKWMK